MMDGWSRRRWMYCACAGWLGSSVCAQEGEAVYTRVAMERQCQVVLRALTRKGGYMTDEKVRIHLPEFLDDASRMLKTTGYGRPVEELVLALNRTAELALAPLQEDVLQSLRSWVPQATHRVAKPAPWVAQWQEKVQARLVTLAVTTVEGAMPKAALPRRYDAVVDRMAQLGLLGREPLDLPRYVAERMIQGVFVLMAIHEQQVRAGQKTG